MGRERTFNEGFEVYDVRHGSLCPSLPSDSPLSSKKGTKPRDVTVCISKSSHSRALRSAIHILHELPSVPLGKAKACQHAAFYPQHNSNAWGPERCSRITTHRVNPRLCSTQGGCMGCCRFLSRGSCSMPGPSNATVLFRRKHSAIFS